MGYEVYTSSGKTIEIYSDEESITVSVSGFDGAVNYPRNFYMRYKRESQSSSNYDYLGDGYMEVSANAYPDDPWENYQDGLLNDTCYSVRITVYNSNTLNVVWEWEEEAAIYTDPLPIEVPIPYIYDIDTSYGLDDVRIYWDVENEHVNGTTYYFYAKKSGGSYYYKTEATKVPSSGYTSIDVDSFNTTYYVYIKAEYEGEYEESSAESFIVELTIPNPWNWTTTEKNVFNNNGLISTITRTRWNNFISWAQTIIAYINDRDGASHATIPNSAVMGTDKILYAESWNAVDYYSRVACGDSSHVTRESGDPVKGSYFTSLTDILNNEL